MLTFKRDVISFWTIIQFRHWITASFACSNTNRFYVFLSFDILRNTEQSKIEFFCTPLLLNRWKFPKCICLDVKAVQVAYEVLRVTFASPEHFRAAKSFSAKHLFGFWCSILGGGPPIMRVHVFDFSFEEGDRSLEVAFETYGAVKVFVSFVVSWSTSGLQS